MDSILIQGARVLDPVQNLDARRDVLISGDRIVRVDEQIDPVTIGKPREVVAGKGRLLVPGLIDIHTHLREPGDEHKETIETGCRAAAAGGFAALLCMPNTRPVNDEPSVTKYILERAALACGVKVLPVASITRGLQGDRLTDFEALKDAGAVSFSDDGRPVSDGGLMKEALEQAGRMGLPVIAHCEDPGLSAGGAIHEGEVSRALGVPGIPASAEETMVARDIALAEHTGADLHIAHVSTAGSVRIIREAKERGAPISAEATPHHFTLSDQAVHDSGADAKMNPPLRGADHVEALREALCDGTIDAIASDHAPHSPEEKATGLLDAPFGVIGLETTFPLTMKLVHDGIISLSRAITLLAVNPYRIAGLAPPSIRPGSPADLTVIDMAAPVNVEPERFFSKSRNSPFRGWTLKGRAVLTVVSGKIVFRISDHRQS